NKMHNLLMEKLAIDDIIVCPHDAGDDCRCRKPKAGMLLDGAQKWNIDIKKSFLIGDTWKDIDAGKSAGCKSILIDMPYNKDDAADFRVDNLFSAADLVHTLE
ncbi:MAG: HAD-IIIA family hydrolase, partial [Nitrospirae bacterium]|nr:HAD-IIIA family hydrolase [Nitrospirota bacterium]